MQAVSYLQFVIFCFCKHGFAANLIQRRFLRVVSLETITITDLSQSSAESMTDCATECATAKDCASFFYDEPTGSCIRTPTAQICSADQNYFDETCCFYTLDTGMRDCADIKTKDPSSQDGLYTIDPQDGHGPFQVYCDMTTDGGGWTVFQRRVDATVDFYKTWKEYKKGFGSLCGNFWLGNDKIHRLTAARASQMRVDMIDGSDAAGYAKYSTFSIDSEVNKYKLHVSGFSGDRGDSFQGHHNGKMFSTWDQDNDDKPLKSCASDASGAWWYGACHDSNLNGLHGSGAYGNGINWVTWTGHYGSLKLSVMKIKPI